MQVHVALHIMGERVGISGRYTSRLMFGVGNKAARSQVYARLYILDGKIGIYDRSCHMYRLRFIFWLGKQVLVAGIAPHVLGG